MRTYRRILALIELSPEGEAVARRALQMARAFNAALGIGFVVDYQPGFECDHVPFRTPAEMREAIVGDVRGKLDRMVAAIGAAGAEVLVVSGTQGAAVTEMVGSWQPDLLLTGSEAARGLDATDKDLPFDVLRVRTGRPGLVGRLIHALAGAF